MTICLMKDDGRLIENSPPIPLSFQKERGVCRLLPFSSQEKGWGMSWPQNSAFFEIKTANKFCFLNKYSII